MLKTIKVPVVKTLFLLLIPTFIVIAGLITMAIITGALSERTAMTLLFTIGAALVNVVPFLILFGLHYIRVRDKTGPRNYSFWTAYLFAILAMCVIALSLLKEIFLGRPGSQLTGAGFFLLPILIVLLILLGYITGWVVEWRVRKHQAIYVADDARRRLLFKQHILRFRHVYISLVGILLISYVFPLIANWFTCFYSKDIFKVVSCGSTRQLQKFIDQGIDINTRNKDGETLLHIAVFYGHKNMVEYLISKNAQIDVKDNIGFTPLHIAAKYGETEMVDFLIKQGANVNAQDNSGDTPLYEAVRKGETTTAKLLIENGADVNLQGNFGWTPIFSAALYGYKNTTKLLLKNGADVNITDKRGRTPLAIAIGEKYENIERLLRKYGAKEQSW